MEQAHPPGQISHTGVGPLPKGRDLIVAILLSIFTFGIYNLYWLYSTWKETAEHMGRPHQANVALVLAIVAWIFFIVAFVITMIVQVMAVVAAVNNGPDPATTGGSVAATLGGVVFMMIASFFLLAVQLWMMWGAAGNAEMLLKSRGIDPAIPAIVHVLVPIILGIWVTVAIAMVQNDLNKLHQR